MRLGPLGPGPPNSPPAPGTIMEVLDAIALPYSPAYKKRFLTN